MGCNPCDPFLISAFFNCLTAEGYPGHDFVQNKVHEDEAINDKEDKELRICIGTIVD